MFYRPKHRSKNVKLGRNSRGQYDVGLHASWGLLRIIGKVLVSTAENHPPKRKD